MPTRGKKEKLLGSSEDAKVRHGKNGRGKTVRNEKATMNDFHIAAASIAVGS
jgi:hypothetical protein